jgi:AcrR family transcriptional regulator
MLVTAELRRRMPTDKPKPAARRADAERNREKILAAARPAFAAGDGDVSMAEVSRRAGVGMATLYRNFPGRRQLLEALYTEEVDSLCAAAETVAGETAGERLMTWLRRFAGSPISSRHIARELLENLGGESVFNDSRARLLSAGRPLLAAAQRSREVRKDLKLDQVLSMIISIGSIPGEPRYRNPIMRAALDGLYVRPT